MEKDIKEIKDELMSLKSAINTASKEKIIRLESRVDSLESAKQGRFSIVCQYIIPPLLVAALVVSFFLDTLPDTRYLH